MGVTVPCSGQDACWYSCMQAQVVDFHSPNLICPAPCAGTWHVMGQACSCLGPSPVAYDSTGISTAHAQRLTHGRPHPDSAASPLTSSKPTTKPCTARAASEADQWIGASRSQHTCQPHEPHGTSCSASEQSEVASLSDPGGWAQAVACHLQARGYWRAVQDFRCPQSSCGSLFPLPVLPFTTHNLGTNAHPR